MSSSEITDAFLTLSIPPIQLDELGSASISTAKVGDNEEMMVTSYGDAKREFERRSIRAVDVVNIANGSIEVQNQTNIFHMTTGSPEAPSGWFARLN